MIEYIFVTIVGIVCIVIGILNTKGHISMLHSYHVKRVKEEDKIPFGKKVGTGTIIVGCSIMVSGVLSMLNYTVISNVITGAGLTAGLIIIFYAMFKYNKGIF